MSIVWRKQQGSVKPSGQLYFKAARAKEHLDKIDAEIAKSFHAEPYLIEAKNYPKKFKRVIRVQGKAIAIEQVPMLIGEFAYCLRSGLDQMAWRLARLHVACPSRHTSFPIRDGSIPVPLGDAVKDILPAAVIEIEALQPYHRGARYKEHPLWIINRLSTIDKHRTIAFNSISVRGKISGTDYVIRDLDYGMDIIATGTNWHKLEFDPHPPEIVFGEPVSTCYGAFEVTIATLRSVHDFVRNEVIPRFARFGK